jgi:hypothetical protein
LLRNPKIIGQSFDPLYIKEVYTVVHSLTVEYHVEAEYRIYLILMHLVFAKISNLQDFKELGAEREKIISVSKEI